MSKCDLCVGECRGHSLGHPEEWVPEPGSRDAASMSKDIEEIATDEDFVRVAALVEHAHQFNPPACYVHADLFPPLRRIIATAQAYSVMEKRLDEALPIFERVTRLAHTLSCDVPVTAEARKHIQNAYDALAALNNESKPMETGHG